jgi:hypothetical protein
MWFVLLTAQTCPAQDGNMGVLPAPDSVMFVVCAGIAATML